LACRHDVSTPKKTKAICWARGSKFYTHQVRHKKEAGDMYPQSRYYIHISLKSFVYIGKDGEYTSSRMCTIQK